MTTKVTIHRLPTGVPGLDEVLGGGLPELSFNLIAGQPGSGKTTLAHQLMFSMATPDRPALYLTVLGEPPLKMLRYQQQFAFFDAAAINQSVRFLNLADETLSGDLDNVLRRIVEEVEAYNPAFVFVDSFRSVMLADDAAGNAHNSLQHFVQQLGMLMTSWQATTFLIGEYFVETDANPVFTVADGLIWLRQSVQRNSMVRKMEVMKMRGQASLPGLHTFRMSAAGIEVFPPAGATLRSGMPPVPVSLDERVLLGVPPLDEMLGGGLPRGYSLLVAGPSGSGKSILAAAFLAEGAARGETGVIASFEQRPDHARNAVVSELLASGMVSLVDARPSDLSIDEILRLLMAEIRRLKANRVVIDSLSGFELAIAPTFREDFREELARLVAALSATGVTVLMTSELEDRYTDLRFSPYGTAFLTDAIIVQRYVELDSRLRRVLAVVKVRGNMHSNELREYTIDDGGLQVGAMLSGQHGLLGGRPTTRAAGANGAGDATPRRRRPRAVTAARGSEEGAHQSAQGELARLQGEIDQARTVLQGLEAQIAQVRHRVGESHTLLAVNQQLVLATLRAQIEAEAVARSAQDATLAAQRQAQADGARRHAQLSEANERLLMAALGAQQLQAAAEQVQKRQADLLAIVAHELRHPLAPIRNAAAVLGRMPDQSPILARMQVIIEQQVKHMARLVGDLLDSTRATTGKLRMEREPLDLVPIIEDALGTCQPALELRLQKLVVRELPASVPMVGDPVRLAQVFGNLLDNASKYTPNRGEIRVSLEVLDAQAVITVADTGIGITADALPHVFEPFVQELHATVFNGLGLGLGLTVVHELVEAHGGTVTASSAGPGLGSQFVVVLPLSADAHAPA